MTAPRLLLLESRPVRLAVQGVGFALLTLFLTSLIHYHDLPFLLAILGGLFCFCLLRNPDWGVLLLVVLWFLSFSPEILGRSYLRVPQLIAAFLLGPLLLRILRDREVWVWRVPQVRYLLAIGLLFILSTWWSEYKYPVTLLPQLDQTAERMQRFFTRLVLVIFMAYFFNTRKKLDRLVWLIVGLTIASIIQPFSKMLMSEQFARGWAAFGYGTNPTSLPYVCLFAASLLWCYHSDNQRTGRKIWTLPLLVVLPVVAAASGSRTGIVQLATFGALAVSSSSRSQRWRGMFVLAAATFLVSTFVPTLALFRSTSFDLTEHAPGGHSLVSRLTTVYAGLEIFASDPIFGAGIGNFAWRSMILTGSDLEPHNSYLWALAEGGIGVFVLYLFLFYATYRTLRKLEISGPRQGAWLATGLRFNLILLLVFSLSDDTWLHDLTFIILGTTIALHRLAQPNPRSNAARPVDLVR